jgi:hypothetical protein
VHVLAWQDKSFLIVGQVWIGAMHSMVTSFAVSFQFPIGGIEACPLAALGKAPEAALLKFAPEPRHDHSIAAVPESYAAPRLLDRFGQ